MFTPTTTWLPLMGVLAATSFTLGGCTSTKLEPPEKSEEAAKSVESTLAPRSKLPLAIRRGLARKMTRHGDDMTNLHWAVLTLDHPGVEGFAQALSEEPTFSRLPAGTEDSNLINTQIPEVFFELQDVLLKKADALQKAAATKERAAVSTAYTDLLGTCVECHAHYLEGVPETH